MSCNANWGTICSSLYHFKVRQSFINSIPRLSSQHTFIYSSYMKVAIHSRKFFPVIMGHFSAADTAQLYLIPTAPPACPSSCSELPPGCYCNIISFVKSWISSSDVSAEIQLSETIIQPSTILLPTSQKLLFKSFVIAVSTIFWEVTPPVSVCLYMLCLMEPLRGKNACRIQAGWSISAWQIWADSVLTLMTAVEL